MTTPTDLAQALRKLITEWRTRVPATAPSTVRVVMREWCADELERVVNAHESRAQPASVAGERERCACVCEAMRPHGGRAWSEEQAACYDALTAAAKNIRDCIVPSQPETAQEKGSPKHQTEMLMARTILNEVIVPPAQEGEG